MSKRRTILFIFLFAATIFAGRNQWTIWWNAFRPINLFHFNVNHISLVRSNRPVLLNKICLVLYNWGNHIPSEWKIQLISWLWVWMVLCLVNTRYLASTGPKTIHTQTYRYRSKRARMQWDNSPFLMAHHGVWPKFGGVRRQQDYRIWSQERNRVQMSPGTTGVLQRHGVFVPIGVRIHLNLV